MTWLRDNNTHINKTTEKAASQADEFVMNDLDRCPELDEAIKDAIITGVGFLMVTVDALDIDGNMHINYKKIDKEEVILSKSSQHE